MIDERSWMDYFEHEDEVRDSETDVAGVVNHAHFLNFMANVRHKHLRALGLDFQLLLARGIMLVASKIEIRFRLPLFAGELYCATSKLLMQPEKQHFSFQHSIKRRPDGALVAKGQVRVACVDCQSNAPVLPDDLRDVLLLHTRSAFPTAD